MAVWLIDDWLAVFINLYIIAYFHKIQFNWETAFRLIDENEPLSGFTPLGLPRPLKTQLSPTLFITFLFCNQNESKSCQKKYFFFINIVPSWSLLIGPHSLSRPPSVGKLPGCHRKLNRELPSCHWKLNLGYFESSFKLSCLATQNLATRLGFSDPP